MQHNILSTLYPMVLNYFISTLGSAQDLQALSSQEWKTWFYFSCGNFILLLYSFMERRIIILRTVSNKFYLLEVPFLLIKTFLGLFIIPNHPQFWGHNTNFHLTGSPKFMLFKCYLLFGRWKSWQILSEIQIYRQWQTNLCENSDLGYRAPSFLCSTCTIVSLIY